jgi:hypothetical protein
VVDCAHSRCDSFIPEMPLSRRRRLVRERPLERVDSQATFALGSRSRYPALRDEREVRTERRGDKRRLQLHRLP